VPALCSPAAPAGSNAASQLLWCLSAARCRPSSAHCAVPAPRRGPCWRGTPLARSQSHQHHLRMLESGGTRFRNQQPVLPAMVAVTGCLMTDGAKGCGAAKMCQLLRNSWLEADWGRRMRRTAPKRQKTLDSPIAQGQRPECSRPHILIVEVVQLVRCKHRIQVK